MCSISLKGGLSISALSQHSNVSSCACKNFPPHMITPPHLHYYLLRLAFFLLRWLSKECALYEEEVVHRQGSYSIVVTTAAR